MKLNAPVHMVDAPWQKQMIHGVKLPERDVMIGEQQSFGPHE
jgi:hypothetical protein